jgi:hypothetical protein
MRSPFTHRAGSAGLVAIALVAATSAAIGQTPDSRPGEPSPERDPYLSELGAILGASQVPLSVHLCFAGAEKLGDLEIRWGALVAEALALRAGYRPLQLSYGPQLEPESFNVLIGTVDQLRDLIPGPDGTHIASGYIALQRARGQHNGYYLFVAGRTAGDIEGTLVNFGFTRKPLPANSTSFISDLIPPASPEFARQAPLEAGTKVTFAELQGQGLTIAPLESGGVSLSLFLPGYLRTNSDSQVTLNLHLRSAVPLRLELNGQQVSSDQSHPSESTTGESECSILIPMRLFQQGRNVLTISPAIASPTGPGGKDFKIFADSEIALSNGAQGGPAPDLRLVSRTFYPFIGRPDGSDVAIVLANRDSETIEATWTLLGRLAQSANTLFYAAQFDGYDSPRDRVVVGTYSHLAPAFRRIAALRVFDEANKNISLAELSSVPPGNNLKHLIEHMLKEDEDPAEELAETAEVSKSSPRSAANREFGIIAFAKIPSAGTEWNLVLTAFTPGNLLQRARSLVQPDFWDQLRGDIARWKDAPGSLESHTPGGAQETSTTVGVELPLGERLGLGTWVIVMCGALILYVIVTAGILGRIDRSPRFRANRSK